MKSHQSDKTHNSVYAYPTHYLNDLAWLFERRQKHGISNISQLDRKSQLSTNDMSSPWKRKMTHSNENKNERKKKTDGNTGTEWKGTTHMTCQHSKQKWQKGKWNLREKDKWSMEGEQIIKIIIARVIEWSQDIPGSLNILMNFLHNQIKLAVRQVLDQCEIMFGGCIPEVVIELELGSLRDKQCPCIHWLCWLKSYITIGDQCEDLGELLNDKFLML